MERTKDKKNILIVFLLVIVLLMSVGFALLSSELEVEATGTIAGDWAVKFKSGSLEQTNKTDGVSDVTAELDTNGLKVTLNATFAKPGDSVSYRVVVENTGTINALLKDVRAVGSDANTSAIQLAYTVNNKAETTVYAKGTVVGKTLTEEQEPIAAATLVKKNGETIDNNYLDITLEYLETAEDITSGASATYTLYLDYEQEKATTNNE